VEQSLLAQSIKPLKDAVTYVEHRFQGWKNEIAMRLEAQEMLDRLPDGGQPGA